jgi:hypothetical protein
MSRVLSALPRDWRNVAKNAIDQGWSIEQGRKHVKWYAPDGATVFTSLSPSCHRALLNHVSIMRRHGYKG